MIIILKWFTMNQRKRKRDRQKQISQEKKGKTSYLTICFLTVMTIHRKKKNPGTWKIQRMLITMRQPAA